MSKLMWMIQEQNNGVVLSIRQKAEGFKRGEHYQHYWMTKKDALEMAEALVNSIK